jgi:enoyl-CoA hydratase/3-hydroxyacyl-CoA dehydrogenase
MVIKIGDVAVIGAGTMGHGIAQVFAMKGIKVNLVDISDDILKKAIDRIRWSLSKFAEKGRISREDVEATLERIKTYTNIYDAVLDADFILEVVPEDIDLKIKIFKEIDKYAPKHASIATNTSGLPITAMAEATQRPEKISGMHWFNPPQLMKLIEIIKSKYTSDETANLLFKLAKEIGKEPIIVKKDIRGFIANRIYRAIRYEAFSMVLRGEAKPEEIDSPLRYKLNLPMGVFELVDLTGAIEIEILEDKEFVRLRNRYPEWEPHEEYVKFRSYALTLSRKYYEKNLLGVKTGRGFYSYPEPGKWKKVEISEKVGGRIEPVQLIAPAINVSAWLIGRKYVNQDEVDIAIKLGYNWPKGIIELAFEWGLEEVINVLQQKRSKYKEEYYSKIYEPDPHLNFFKTF